VAVIVIPSRWQRQPTGPVEIDWSHEMAQDLMGAFCGGLDVDLTQPNGPAVYTNTASAEQQHVGTEYGVARRVGGVSGHVYWQVQRRGVNSATAGMTAWGRVCPLTNPSNVFFTLARNNSSRTYGWGYQVTTRKLSAYFRNDSGTAYVVPGDRVVSAFDWHDAGSVLAGTDLSLYDGGYLAASGAVAGSTTTTRFSLGDSSMGAFLVPVCYLWAGAHPEYMQELSRNPWQLFRHRLYKFVSLGSGGAYTLTADAGTYSVSAADAGMRAARRLSANAGSYAYSGAAAGLYVGRRLTADAAAYSVTGNDAVLSYSGGVTHYTMTADAGSFAVTGSAASLIAGRKLVAAAGSYSVGGQTAAFARAYRLTADATSYSVSLNAATLTYSGAGSLLWTPQTPGAASWVAQSAGPATWTPQ